MKMSKLLLAIIATVAISQPVIAQEQGSQHQPAGGSSQMMENMHQKMQLRMQDMRQQMEQIHATDDAEERNRLMGEHMQSMREAMTMMGNMQPSMMQSRHADAAGPDHHGDAGDASMCTGDAAQCERMREMTGRQGHMEQRMGMMQMMMQQMMERESVSEDDHH